MVAIISYIYRGLLCLGFVFLLSASYAESGDALVARSGEIERQIDSLMQLVGEKRQEIATADSDAVATLGAEIVSIEQQLFDLRIEQGRVATELTSEGITNGNTIQSETPLADSGATLLSSSKLVSEGLSEEDYENLQDAEEDEVICDELFTQYVKQYSRLRELKLLYDQTDIEDEAVKYNDEFKKLELSADSLSLLLEDRWSELYDNKNYAYAMVLELLGDDELLARDLDITRNVAAQISVVEHYESTLPILNYEYQKRGQLELELLLAERLKLKRCVDSLTQVQSLLSARRSFEDLAEVVIEERNFIEYSAITFSTSTIYSKSNPVPAAVEYERGVIYRIQLGAYKYEQLPTIFRGASPLCYDKTLGFWTYYAGGFATLSEAESAVEVCIRRGFKRPEIVVWRDGVRRNLYRDPLPKHSGYRVQLDGSVSLSDNVKGIISSISPDADLSKVGSDRFIIATIEEQSVAERLVSSIESADDVLQVTLIAVD